MKLAVLGFGQCGCNIADQFYAVNNYAKSVFQRRMEIVTDAFAINTDETDLGGFKHIPKDKTHRILVGSMTTFGHGVGKMNMDAAKIIKSSHLMVMDTVLSSRSFHDADVVISIASGGGGTGSGIIGWILKELKEQVSIPVYGIVVLPFGFEQDGDSSYAVTNSATCINTVLKYTDALFLIDNERFRRSGVGLSENLRGINSEIVESFYDLLCAGEEKNQKYVGSKVMDAGDIERSLASVSVIGRGQVSLPVFRLRNNFREGFNETIGIVSALRQAEQNLSLKVNIEDARKLLIMIGAPQNTISASTLEEITKYFDEKAPKAVVRIGDYPRRANEISVSLIASQMTKVTKLENLYQRAEILLAKHQQIEDETAKQVGEVLASGDRIPSLA
ncbi:MAG: hypothetical protein WCB17_06470 [Dehalococcoidales bacterium]|jgi:cell division GTPase FtsZ